MSSSKVFKEDKLFTPHSLVRQSIEPPAPKSVQPAPSPPKAAPKEALKEKEDQAEMMVPPEPAATKPAPKPSVPPKSEPAPAPPPEPPVDIKAIRQEGYNQGVADSTARMQAQFEQCMRGLAEACQKIDNLHSERMASSHADLVNLVISLTEKILDRELSTPRNQIALTLETALEQAIASEEFHITLHPEDLAFAEEKAPALISSIRGLEHLVFKADPGIRRGGCLLESVTCTVDATIDGKMESTRELLTEHPELLLPSEDGSTENKQNKVVAPPDDEQSKIREEL